ncbi:MAG: bL9 family ribosomal protein [Cyanobium sp. MAG06]|nr:bL9 family ribosomal protein [Cyanobium sp. MAG06]
MKIKVILNCDIPRVGQKGSILEVTRVYAENVLLKNNNATIATPHIIEQHKKKLELLKNKKEEINNEHNKVFQDISQKGIIINRKSDKNNHLYAKVKAQDIIDYVYDKYKISVNSKQILLQDSDENNKNNNIEIADIGEYVMVFIINNHKYKTILTINNQ